MIAICADDKHPSQSAWKEVTDCLEKNGIVLRDLDALLATFIKLKNGYLKELIEKAGRSSYTELQNNNSILFDKNGMLKDLQSIQGQLINKRSGLKKETQVFTLAQWYYELLTMVVQRLPENQRSFNHIFEAVTAQQKEEKTDNRNINMLLIALGETPIMKGEKRKKLIEDYAEEFIEDETLEQTDKPEMPVALIPEPAAYSSSQSTIQPEIDSSFVPVTTKIKQWVEFFGDEPYTITLFNVREFITYDNELRKAYALFKTCPQLKNAQRVEVLFAAADSLLAAQEAKIANNKYGHLCLTTASTAFDPSIIEKLTIDHLFSRKVEGYLKSYGVAQQINSLIQITIPGEIKDNAGNTFLVFFQLSCVPNLGPLSIAAQHHIT